MQINMLDYTLHGINKSKTIAEKLQKDTIMTVPQESLKKFETQVLHTYKKKVRRFSRKKAWNCENFLKTNISLPLHIANIYIIIHLFGYLYRCISFENLFDQSCSIIYNTAYFPLLSRRPLSFFFSSFAFCLTIRAACSKTLITELSL